MNQIGGELWTVYHGDCRDVFGALPERSVHTIMTSPPYWGGIRDYGIPHAVWGGDPGCDHDWSDSTTRNSRLTDESAGPKQRTNTGAVGHRIEKASETCRKCGAWSGCFGDEPTVALYVAHTVMVFEALGHALRDDGVIWWNLGDTFATSGGDGGPGMSSQREGRAYQQRNGRRSKGQEIGNGNKALVPFRVALGLQAAGWIVRQENIWNKASPMPESVDGVRWERCRVKVQGDSAPNNGGVRGGNIEAWNLSTHPETRVQAKWAYCPGCRKCQDHPAECPYCNGDMGGTCEWCKGLGFYGGWRLRRGSWRSSTSHEYVFQIVKSAEYFCDAAAAQEPCTGGAHSRGSGMTAKMNDGCRSNQRFYSNCSGDTETRNPRSVWSITSEGYKGKHFAAYPRPLVWKCIQASSSQAGCCPACGAQYAPVVERRRVATRPGCKTKVGGLGFDAESPYQEHKGNVVGNRDPQRHITIKEAVGYRPTCECNAGDPVPCTVGDPFTGSGTTMQVAINTGRRFVGAEIGEHYLKLIQERAAKPWSPVKAAKKRAVEFTTSQGRLFE